MKSSTFYKLSPPNPNPTAMDKLSGQEIDRRLSYIKSTIDMIPDEETADRAKASFLLQLEEGYLMDIPVELQDLGITSWRMTVPERRRALALPDKQKFLAVGSAKRLAQYLDDGRTGLRRSEWIWRIGQCMEQLKRWYPFFITLTVDPHVADAREIMEDPSAFKSYRQKLAEVIRRVVGVSQRSKGGPPVTDYMRYSAVIEHGKSRTHHHLHALIWCRDIPVRWKTDPNYGRRPPTLTEIPYLKSLWPYATVTKCEAFRYIGDPWTRLGWQVPVKNGKPLELHPPSAAGAYLAKYLGKEDKEWNHRMKASRNLGLTELNDFLVSQTTAWLFVAANRPWDPESQRQARKSSVPPSLLRRKARSLILSRLWRSQKGRQRISKWLRMPTLNAYRTMLASVRDGAEPWAMDTEQRSTWLTEVTYRPAMSVSSETLARVWQAVAAEFPALPQQKTRALSGSKGASKWT